MVKVFIVKRESKEKKKQAGHGQGYLRENGEEQSRGRSQRTPDRASGSRGPAGKRGSPPTGGILG